MSERMMKVVQIFRCTIYCIGFVFAITTIKSCHPPQYYLIYDKDNENVDKDCFWPCDMIPHPELPDPTPESEPILS